MSSCWVISLKAAKNTKEIQNPCLWIPVLSSFCCRVILFILHNSFWYSWKIPRRNFPREGLHFHLTPWGPGLSVHPRGRKINPRVVLGAAAGSQLRREKMLGSGSMEALKVIWREKRSHTGATRTFGIPWGTWSSGTTARSVREAKMMEVGEEEASNYRSLDWMMYGEVRREKLSRHLTGEGWDCDPAPG